MEEYKPNSYRSKEVIDVYPDKGIQKVVSNPVKSRKKSSVRKLSEVFISEDIDNVKDYILMDVLLPAIKKAISDTVTNGIDMILYGETGRTKKNTSASRVSYGGYYTGSNDRYKGSENHMRTGYSYDEVIIDNRGEAEEVLCRMDELIEMYGIVSVADLYDLIGKSHNYTDNKYGWTDIRSASVVRVRGGGYTIKLPRALPLD